jgi:hypothetical protein
MPDLLSRKEEKDSLRQGEATGQKRAVERRPERGVDTTGRQAVDMVPGFASQGNLFRHARQSGEISMPEELTEFTTTVKKQGTMLCLPLGKTLGLALQRFGFAPDQPVVVRFSAQRLEIRPVASLGAVRDQMLRSVDELRAFREKMRGLLAALPHLTDEQLEAGETPEGELLGTLECLISDDLDPAIRKLQSVERLQEGEGPRSR